jgi:hypothetical protein
LRVSPAHGFSLAVGHGAAGVERHHESESLLTFGLANHDPVDPAGGPPINLAEVISGGVGAVLEEVATLGARSGPVPPDGAPLYPTGVVKGSSAQELEDVRREGHRRTKA